MTNYQQTPDKRTMDTEVNDQPEQQAKYSCHNNQRTTNTKHMSGP